MEPGIPVEDDVAYNATHGGFELETTGNHPNSPTVLLGGGNILMKFLEGQSGQ